MYSQTQKLEHFQQSSSSDEIIELSKEENVDSIGLDLEKSFCSLSIQSNDRHKAGKRSYQEYRNDIKAFSPKSKKLIKLNKDESKDKSFTSLQKKSLANVLPVQDIRKSIVKMSPGVQKSSSAVLVNEIPVQNYAKLTQQTHQIGLICLEGNCLCCPKKNVAVEKAKSPSKTNRFDIQEAKTCVECNQIVLKIHIDSPILTNNNATKCFQCEDKVVHIRCQKQEYLSEDFWLCQDCLLNYEEDKINPESVEQPNQQPLPVIQQNVSPPQNHQEQQINQLTDQVQKDQQLKQMREILSANKLVLRQTQKRSRPATQARKKKLVSQVEQGLIEFEEFTQFENSLYQQRAQSLSRPLTSNFKNQSANSSLHRSLSQFKIQSIVPRFDPNRSLNTKNQ